MLDDSAVRKLIETYADRVFNTCLGFVKDRGDAEDLCQEVFVTVCTRRSRFRGEAQASTWMYRIAVNKCISFLRRKKSRGKNVPLDLVAQDPSDDFYHPGVRIENRERNIELYKALDSLAPDHRAAFLLHKMEGLSYREIGDIMGKSVGSVTSTLHRVRARLRERLGGTDSGDN